MPKVIRSCPEMVSIPTAASPKPSAIAATILKREPFPIPTKLQKVRK